MGVKATRYLSKAYVLAVQSLLGVCSALCPAPLNDSFLCNIVYYGEAIRA